eukprot:12896402-Prorocentrum_lima.AAC.1
MSGEVGAGGLLLSLHGQMLRCLATWAHRDFQGVGQVVRHPVIRSRLGNWARHVTEARCNKVSLRGRVSPP